MDELLKYRVYEVNDIGVRAGISQEPLKDLKCAFETKEMAEDFIEYQKTVNPEKQYALGESQEQEAAKISEADLTEWNKRLQDEGLFCNTNVLEDSFEQYQNGVDFNELVNELIELDSYGNKLWEEKGLQVPWYTLKASFEEYKQGAEIDEIAEQIKEGKYSEPLTAEDDAENYFDASLAEGKTFTIYDKETGEKLFEKPLDEFTYGDALHLEINARDIELDLELNARKSSGWQRFQITDKERNVLVMGDDSAFKRGFKDLKNVLEYQEILGIAGYEFNDLKNFREYQEMLKILGEEKGLQVPMDTLKASFEAYKQGTGINEIVEQIIEGKYDVPLTEYKPVSKEQVEHTEFQEQAQMGQKKSGSGIKNEGTLIKQEIKSQGYRPKPGLVKNINQLNKMMDKSHSLKDISKMYKEKSLRESNPEAQKLVDKIGNELKAQELAKIAPISR